MIAPGNLERTRHVRVLTRLDTLYPGSVHAERHAVFTLAGRRAGVATDTRVVINDESVVHRPELDEWDPTCYVRLCQYVIRGG
ncbi:MAG: hypothetical protein ACI80V_002723 [Rhodothermales bacterium]